MTDVAWSVSHVPGPKQTICSVRRSGADVSDRDNQRARVYDAENETAAILKRGGTIEHFGSVLTIPAERKFGDVDSIQPYVDKVLAFPPIATLPRAAVPVTVRSRRGVTQAHYEHATSTIAIPPYRLSGWALRETVVLHELAHHLTPGAGHGPAFCAALLYLFEHVIAPEAAHLLRVAMYDRGVTIGVPA